MMTTLHKDTDNELPVEPERTADDLAEYLEYLTRITPTTLPEWTD